MSLRQHLLNRCLRLTEKPFLARANPQILRATMEKQARLFFRGPRGVRADWRDLPGAGSALWLTPSRILESRVILYVHGGGFVFGSPETHRAMVARLALLTGARAVLPRYGRVPDAVFPKPAEDVRAAWDALRQMGIAPQDIVIGGDSAGGALVFDLLAQLCGEGAALPVGVSAFSPLLDMTFSGDSFSKNAESDVLLPAVRAAEMARLYLQGQSATSPRASPLFADFNNAPPVWLTVSDSEILRDDSQRFAARLQEAGVSVTFEEAHDLPHVWPLFQNHLPEARATLASLADWINALPRDRADEN
ncbi:MULTISPECIES: alpha/beta hydrolase [Sulfitobacter]|uniref:Monoterpene epsilon-lactone hydrolase n=1 Tax=Sulfitobacter dubius TaxID=218673 RepID=A0ABY3ZTF0_9RHOB|nr:alpha/beta hydrolase [Sulfitobacter dubius]UOA16088.1 Monoterpene epsilon-lactone hydrolase [Sulfitobacter dubius]WOI28558.1 alpha/beta hydrolase [Sulfitobacter dubius]